MKAAEHFTLDLKIYTKLGWQYSVMWEKNGNTIFMRAPH